MPYKPVGVDETGHFPLRVRQALAEEFVTKPEGILDGQIPVWNAATQSWIPGYSEGSLVTSIDGGPPG